MNRRTSARIGWNLPVSRPVWEWPLRGTSTPAIVWLALARVLYCIVDCANANGRGGILWRRADIRPFCVTSVFWRSTEILVDRCATSTTRLHPNAPASSAYACTLVSGIHRLRANACTSESPVCHSDDCFPAALFRTVERFTKYCHPCRWNWSTGVAIGARIGGDVKDQPRRVQSRPWPP